MIVKKKAPAVQVTLSPYVSTLAAGSCFLYGGSCWFQKSTDGIYCFETAKLLPFSNFPCRVDAVLQSNESLELTPE